jgi:hypothetical protein
VKIFDAILEFLSAIERALYAAETGMNGGAPEAGDSNPASASKGPLNPV